MFCGRRGKHAALILAIWIAVQTSTVHLFHNHPILVLTGGSRPAATRCEVAAADHDHEAGHCPVCLFLRSFKSQPAARETCADSFPLSLDYLPLPEHAPVTVEVADGAVPRAPPVISA